MNVAIKERVHTQQAWKRITLGTEPNARALKTQLRGIGCTISYTAHCVMNSAAFTISAHQECSLAIVTPRDLGFPYGEKIGRFYQRAQHAGYALCQPETAVQILLQHGAMLEEEYLRVAMEPVQYCRSEDIFVVGKNGNGPFLDTTIGHLGYLLCSPDVQMVFTYPTVLS